MNCTYLSDLWKFGCWLLTGVQINELDPGIDAVGSSTEHTQGYLHSKPGFQVQIPPDIVLLPFLDEHIQSWIRFLTFLDQRMPIMSRVRCPRIQEYTELLSNNSDLPLVYHTRSIKFEFILWPYPPGLNFPLWKNWKLRVPLPTTVPQNI